MIVEWKGKSITDCSREELFEVIGALTERAELLNRYDSGKLRERISELKAENEKLWKCLGNR